MNLNYRDNILNELKEWLYSVSDEDINKLISQIAISRNIVGYGAGRMGLSLKAFMMRLNHLGKKAYFYTDTFVPAVNSHDLYIFASGSGETKTVLNIAELAKNKDCKIACITGNSDSSLAQISDLIINFKSCNGGLNAPDSPDKINSIQLMSTLNEQGTYLLYDLIVRRYCDIAKLDLKELKKYHNNVE